MVKKDLVFIPANPEVSVKTWQSRKFCHAQHGGFCELLPWRRRPSRQHVGWLVRHCCDNLKASEIQCFKSKPADKPDRGSRYAFPCLTWLDPIAEIGEVVLPVDLIDSTAAKKSIIFRIEYNEIIFDTFRPHLGSGTEPWRAVRHRVIRMTPWCPL